MTAPATTPHPGSTAIAPGLCSVTFRSLTSGQVIELAVRAGLAHLEWGGDIHVPHGDLRAARAVATASAEAGLVVASYGSYLRAGRLGTARTAKIGRVLDTAAALGARNVRVWAVGDQPAAELAAVCTVAEGHGLTVSLEYHPGTATETAAGTKKLLTDVGAPNLRTYWQPDPTLGCDDQLGELVAVSPWLSHLHVFTWTPQRARLPLAEGASLWRAAFGIATRAPAPPGAQRVAFLEFVRGDDPHQLLDDAPTLQRWLGEER